MIFLNISDMIKGDLVKDKNFIIRVVYYNDLLTF